jgi:DNA (cytosine-5)-methyltransferase 1
LNGGLEQGVQAVLGGSTAWVSDIDKGACKILAHRYPDAPNLGDIAAVKWTPDCPTCGDLLALYWNDDMPEGRGYYCPHDGWFDLDIWRNEPGVAEPVEILTGGFPCQDVSHAGKRAGLRPDTRTGLWSQMAYAINQLRPALVVAENVRGLLSAEAHSDVEPCPWCMGDGGDVPVLRALGAVLGDLADIGYDAVWYGLRAADVGAPHGRFRVFVVAYPQRGGLDGWTPDALGGQVGGTAAAGSGEVALLPTPATSDTNGPGAHGDGGLDLRTAVSLLPTPMVGSTSDAAHGQISGQWRDAMADALARWGDYADAIARWEHTLGRPAPAPTQASAKGNPQLAPAFVEWMMGIPAGWVTDVPGITRNEALKACGNGVVPQQAEAALRILLPALEVAA